MPRRRLTLGLAGAAGGGIAGGIFLSQTGAPLESLILFGTGAVLTMRLIALARRIPWAVPSSVQLILTVLLVKGAWHLFWMSPGPGPVMLMLYYVVSGLFFAYCTDGLRP